MHSNEISNVCNLDFLYNIQKKGILGDGHSRHEGFLLEVLTIIIIRMTNVS